MPNIPKHQEVIADILMILRDSAHESVPVGSNGTGRGERDLWVVSPLAAGADQWVADEGLRLGFKLYCPLPFPRQKYRKDFTDPECLATFDRLLSRASQILEVEEAMQKGGLARWQGDESYAAVGCAVLAHSDVLLVVWDGKESRAKGSTASVARMAMRSGLPVVWIPWDKPESWRLQRRGTRVMEESIDGQGRIHDLAHLVRIMIHS